MSNLILIGIIVFIAIWVYIGYEFYRAPLIPDDYDEDHALDLLLNLMHDLHHNRLVLMGHDKIHILYKPILQ